MFEHHQQAIIRHAEAAFPEECCGLIYNGEYVPLQNVDPEPEDHFALSLSDEERYLGDPLTEAIVHSHPVGPIYPSEPDMRSYLSGTLPWVIAAHSNETGWKHLEMGDHLLDYDLDGRPFCHGIFDCYDEIRSWWWQRKGVRLKNFARRDAWWLPEKDASGKTIGPALDLYADHFKDADFVEMPKGTALSEALPGDVFFIKLDFVHEMHAMIYDGDGTAWHHLPHQLSCRVVAEPWANRASRWVRHKSLFQGAEQ